MTAAAPFPIVGVGASAGGIEALKGFFAGIPEAPGFAVVIITHLNPARQSLLHEIVARHTRMPVHIATDQRRRSPPATVYVLAGGRRPGHSSSGRLLITRPELGHGAFASRSTFSSAALARDRGEHAAGVVLSGSDGDGTLGIKVDQGAWRPHAWPRSVTATARAIPACRTVRSPPATSISPSLPIKMGAQARSIRGSAWPTKTGPTGES